MKIIIDVNEETGNVSVMDGGFSIIEVLGYLELAKHIITHNDAPEEYDPEEVEKSEKNGKGDMFLGKGGQA